MNLLHPKTDAHSESTASSVASGSSDVVNTMDKNTKIDIKTEISKEVDKLFGPALERTQSNSDLKVIAPLRHKRRQYKSQEILPIVEKMQKDQLPTNVLHSQAQINSIKNMDTSKSSPIPILYDSQRAEIVASVTERLYNKIKKKEEAASQAAAKVESVIDKKIMEPLSELKICTNARQRLIEISQKALRNKRRIGIPAHTQTRKLVTRVKDQEIDIQTDLGMYVSKNKNQYTFRRDAATETTPLTPRCKEISVGSKHGMLRFHDRSTVTEDKKVILKSSYVMTDVVKKCDGTTQTQIVPPPRRKRRATCCKCMQNLGRKPCTDETAPVISINISQVFPADSESQTSADESDNTVDTGEKSESINMTPDLLTNHNNIDPNLNRSTELQSKSNDNTLMEMVKQEVDSTNVLESNSKLKLQSQQNEDFPETECALPRVKVDCSRKPDSSEIKEIILGRNQNRYPYNIVLSPPRVVDTAKRIVKFQEDDDIPAALASSKTVWDWQNKNGSSSDLNETSETANNVQQKSKDKQLEPHVSSYSDSTDSSKAETNSFIWKKGNTPTQYDTSNKTNSLGRSYAPIYRGSKYAKAKAKLYREFLGLDEEVDSQTSPKNSSIDLTSSDSAESREVSNYSFRRRRNILEEKLQFKYNPRNNFRSIENEVMNSCHSLEASVNKYESYLTDFHGNKNNSHMSESCGRTPTEYLQHLVELRRQVVKADYDTDSSFGNMQK